MNIESELIKNVLSQLKHSTEAQHYLSKYHGKPQNQLILIKVGGQVIADDLHNLIKSLSLLIHLGLKPVVLHGAGPQIDAAMQNQDCKAEKIDGIRVTHQSSLNIIQTVIDTVQQQLLQRLALQGISAVALSQQVFICDFEDREKYGYVGAIQSVDLSLINQALECNSIPIISCLGQTLEKQVLNINADIAMKKLVWASDPCKIIFVTPTGGMLNADDQLISAVQLNQEYDHLMQQSWLHSGMRLKIQQIYQLLKPMPRRLSVSVTSAQALPQELFTHKGQGTFLSMGEHINVYKTLGTAAKLQVTSLLQSSFNKQLKSGFFEGLHFLSLLMAQSGQALALVTKGYEGHAYLNKFAVTPLAQGQGLGKNIWQNLLNHYPQIYWRSRRSNPINAWYHQVADCCYKKDDWIFFSCGMEIQQAMACMQEAMTYDDSWQGELA